MANTEKQNNYTLLISMVGHAGSGKSYFARELARRRGFVRINSDSLRSAIFGSAQEVQEQPKHIRVEGIFKGLDYIAEQILLSGKSVIYDSNNNRLMTRKQKRLIAKKCDATSIIVWVKTSKELAVRRVQERDALVDQLKLNKKQSAEVIERHISNLDEPDQTENLIIVDGTESFNKQLSAFSNQLRTLL